MHATSTGVTSGGTATPSAAFAAELASAGESADSSMSSTTRASSASASGPPSYRSDPSLFAAFKSSRLRAAAGSLQQRFASSIHALGELEESHRQSTGPTAPDERAMRLSRSNRTDATLERTVMRQKVNSTPVSMRSGANSRASSTVPSPARPSRTHSPPTHPTAATVQPVTFHASTSNTTPMMAPTADSMRVTPLPPAALPPAQQRMEEPMQHQRALFDSQPTTSMHHGFVPASTIDHSHSATAAAASFAHAAPLLPARPAESPESSANHWEIMSESSSRIRHIQKALGSQRREESPPARSLESIALAALRPTIHVTSESTSGPSAALPVSRPLSVRHTPRSSPARAAARQRSRKKATDALPQHVTRLMKIQSANAARVGETSDDSDDDTFQRRRMRTRIPRSPSIEASPPIRAYRPSPKPDVSDTAVSRRPNSAAASTRVPIHHLADVMLAEDDDDSKTFLHQPTPQAFLNAAAAMQSYESLPKPSFAVNNAPPAAAPSNVHIHLHPSAPLPLSGPTLEPPPVNVSTFPLSTAVDPRASFAGSASMPPDAASMPSGSPRMTAQHPPSWAQQTMIQTLPHQPPPPPQVQQQPFSSFAMQQPYHDSHSYSSAFHPHSHDVRPPIATGVTDADAEFDVLQSLLQGDDPHAPPSVAPTTSMSSQQPPPPSMTGGRHRHAIDNYNWPPHLYDAHSSTSVRTIDDTQLQQQQHHHRRPPPPDPFHYTQTIYQDTHRRSAFEFDPRASSTTLHDPHFHHSFDVASQPSSVGASSAFEPVPSPRFRDVAPMSVSHSVPARSFFQPNYSSIPQPLPAGVAEATRAAGHEETFDVSRYPPILRQQLQQQRLERGAHAADAYVSEESWRSASLLAASSRSRERSPTSTPPRRHASPTSHLADTSFMSPSRLASYLRHYLDHRTQRAEEEEEPENGHGAAAAHAHDPRKLTLSRAESRQLQNVIVELDAMRSAHGITREGQQIVTQRQAAPLATSARTAATDRSGAKLTLSQKKRQSGRAAPPTSSASTSTRLTASSSSLRSSSPDVSLDAAALRSARRALEEDERLAEALRKIARDKLAATEMQRMHTQKMHQRTRGKPSTIDTGMQVRVSMKKKPTTRTATSKK